MNASPPPSKILIIGAGIFGLSTALALLKRPRYANTHITIVDAAKEIPNQFGSSVDSSRIIRADYSDPLYSRLAAEAQVLWRDQSEDGWGGDGRYFEPGFLLTSGGGDEAHREYLRRSLGNVKRLAEEAERRAGGSGKRIEVLEGKERIKRASGYEEVSGEWGYVNWGSGWGDAKRIVAWMAKRVREEGEERVRFKMGRKVDRLIVEGKKVIGVQIGGERVLADLTVLAAGAWSGSLIDLRGRALATGQALTYIDITEDEEKQMKHRPTVMNMSKGMFIIPPRYGKLKVARHGFGYRNLTRIEAKNVLGCENEEGDVEVSLPWNGIEVPKEGQDACREVLQELLPNMANRPFVQTRVCWYSDTPTGDFIIDWYPKQQGVFVATGGSGHGFKFAPVIGEKIVDGIDSTLDSDLKDGWRWRDPMPDFEGCDDGSRAGARGMILKDEMAKA